METVQLMYAGFWLRFVAHVIDQLILGFVRGIIFIPVALATGFGSFFFQGLEDNGYYAFASYNIHGEDEYVFVVALILFILAFVALSVIIEWLYYALMETSSKQATLGKMALGLKVTDLNGNRIKFGKATGRYFGKILSGLFFMIGYIMAGFTEKKQALHDILANCLVVRVGQYQHQNMYNS